MSSVNMVCHKLALVFYLARFQLPEPSPNSLRANIRIRFDLHIVLVCLYSTPSHYHHCANLSEGIALKNKMPVRYILSSVCIRLSILSPLSIIRYGGLYGFSLPIYPVMIERIYILCLIIITKSEVWTRNHGLGLGREKIVPAVCLSIFFFLKADKKTTRYLSHNNFKTTIVKQQWPLLLTWFNFNPSMDK